MEATATPRVTSQYLDNYVGRNVMVVGKVVQLRGDTAVVDADGNVTAHLNRMGSGAQLIGKVNSDLSIKVLSSTTVESPAGVDRTTHRNLIEISASSDYDLYRTVVELSQLPSVKNLFVKDDSGELSVNDSTDRRTGDLDLDISSSDSDHPPGEAKRDNPGGSSRTHRRRYQRKKRKANKRTQMLAVPEQQRSPGLAADTFSNKDWARQERGKEKGSDIGRDAELMMAIWNLAGLHLGTSINVQMCMDEAGRWRVGWGQLVD
ncbi:hypothetical protein GE09DRAFT_1219705 [Coniochaeta sp. 2T2.1]|nr:hypothetical protein GE09DRAFT_1219705 [Coniochaeta sp. 2T2.1]